MNGLENTLTRDWRNAVGKLTTAETHAARAWQWLTQDAPMDIIQAVPDLQSQYAGLHARGRMIEGTISTVRDAVSKAATAARGAYRSAVQYASGLFGFGDLGFVGMITAAAILSSVAAITYWVTEVVAFRQKVAAIQRLVSEGMTPAAAAAALKANPGLLGQAAVAAKAIAVLLGVGMVALYVYRRSEQ